MIEEKEIDKTEVNLHAFYSKTSFNFFILFVSLTLTFIHNFLKSNYFIGTWNILAYLLILAPLAWMFIKKELNNRYTKWFIPTIFILITDIFVYSNDFTQYFLPYIVYLLIFVLYMTSMQNVSSLYQTLIPRKAIPIQPIKNIITLTGSLLLYKEHKNIYNRIALALIITLPVAGLFLLLFMSADSNFKGFVTEIFKLKLKFGSLDLFWIAFYMIFFINFFLFSFSNKKDRKVFQTDKSFDPLIIGIFLGMLNLLFIMFLIFQINYLFGGESYVKESAINIAQFAREGFFQLMWVMGSVFIIFLFIMSRYHGEKNTAFLLSGLILSTMIIGFASLKKMHLYQSLKGATVLRYYVEWFDYFLLLILGLGIIFILKRIPYFKLLNVIVVFGLLSLTIVSSMNVDKMVASHNINKFGAMNNKLDKTAISQLSIDIWPVIKGTDMNFTSSTYNSYIYNRDCSKFSEYHYGYCQLINKYPEAKMKIIH